MSLVLWSVLEQMCETFPIIPYWQRSLINISFTNSTGEKLPLLGRLGDLCMDLLNSEFVILILHFPIKPFSRSTRKNVLLQLSLCLWYLKSSVKMLFKISHVAWYLKSSIKVLFKVSRVACVLEEVSKGGGAVSILVSFHDSAGWSPEEIGLISELRTLIRSLVRNHLRSTFCPDFPMIHPFWSPEHKHPYFQAQTLAVVSAVIFSSPTLLPIARVRWSLDELQSWIHTQLPSGSKVVPSLEQLWLTARVLHWRWSEKQQHWLWKDFENPLQACPSCQPMLCSVFCSWAMPKAWFPELCEMFVAFCWTNMVDEGSAFLSASSGN